MRLSKSDLMYYPAAGCVVLLFAVLAWHFFSGLFLLQEYRQWIDVFQPFNPLAIFDPSTYLQPNGFTIPFSRSMSILSVIGITRICAHNIPCHNSFQIGLLVASGALFAVALRVLVPNVPASIAIAGITMLLFSTPALDALAWQATTLDKFALFYTSLATLVSLFARRTWGLPPTLAFNAVMLVLTFLAYNSKQAAFALAPSLFVLTLVRFATEEPSGLWSACAAALKHYVAPLLYAVFHVCVTVANTLANPVPSARVTAGDSLFNAYHFFAYLFNLEWLGARFNHYPYAPRPFEGATMIFITLFVASAGYLIFRFASARMFWLWLWSVISFALALVITLRTTGVSPFYLLVPSYYVAFFVVFTLACAYDATRNAWRFGLGGAALVLAAAHIAVLFASDDFYAQRLRTSRQFQIALAQVKERLARSKVPLRLVLLWPQTEPTTPVLFIGTAGARSLAPYIVQPGVPFDQVMNYDATIIDRPYTGHPALRPRAGELQVLLGENLRLISER